MAFTKKDFQLLFALLFLLVFFYPELFLARSASLAGDHLEQHYPWAYLLATSVKHFQFPFWTNLIHCGFPLVAEGQIGAFYPPNLILYFLLPIRWAYSYLNIIHFLLSGIGAYIYARQMKLSSLGAFTASIIFLFAAAYGGAYYNITSLKTIAWFPLALFFFERYYEENNLRNLLFLAVSLASSLLAGYLQVASLMLVIFTLYAFFRIFIFYEPDKNIFKQQLTLSFFLIGSIFISIILAFPQLFLTFQLALFSNRLNLTENYAYIGSLSPLSLLTLFLFEIQGFLRGNSLYNGVFSIFFILCAVCSRETRKMPFFRIWFWVGLISFFLALGGWSPLYVAIIKLIRFYSFRMPAKFLVFVCFALAMLAGLGVQNCENLIRSKANHLVPRRAVLVFGILLLLTSLCHLLIFYFVTSGREISLRFGQQFVQKFVFGKMGHPYSLQMYYEKLNASLDSIKLIISFHNFWNVWTYFFFLVSIVFILFLIISKRIDQRWLLGALLFLLVDLYVFTWRDIKRDFEPYKYLDKPSPVIERLRQEQDAGRVGRIYGFRNQSERLPLVPSVNMLYGFEDIGAYSPFVIRRYFEAVGALGNINDSNFAVTPTAQFLIGHRKLLNMLDVSHILSKVPINHPNFETLLYDRESETFLYRNKGEHVRAFFVSSVELFENWQDLKERLLQSEFEPRKVLLLERTEFQKIESAGRNKDINNLSDKPNSIMLLRRLPDSEWWQLETERPGFFVISNTMYPGWFAILNGEATPILKAYGLFQAVWISKAGKYGIQFYFRPYH